MSRIVHPSVAVEEGSHGTHHHDRYRCRLCPMSSKSLSLVALIGFRGLMLQALSEKHNSFLRPLKKKGFKEERVTTMELYDIGKSHDPGLQQEPFRFRASWGMLRTPFLSYIAKSNR